MKRGHLFFIACLHTTVWKFQDFSVTQILREINLGDSRSTKSANLTYLEALNYDCSEFFALCEG